MTCYHPLRRFSIGINPETGKSLGKVVPFAVNYIVEGSNGKYTYGMDDILDHFVGPALPDGSFPESALFYNFGTYAKKVFANSQEIPCGHCIGCRLNYSKQWAVRLMCELPYHKEAWFLTLTYNDENIPTTVHDGKVRHPLVKKDVQLFLKRLRKRFPPNSVHYYCCGEYGSLTHRPHYHMILFLDVPLEETTRSKNILHKVQNGNRYYVNDFIQSIWYRPGNPRQSAGFHYLANVSFDCCSYVANYVTKKLNGGMSYEEFGLTNVFAIMSQKPAIGRQFFEDHESDIYEQYSFLVPNMDKPLRIRPPHYWDNLFDIEHHEELCDYKAVKKKAAEDAILSKMFQTDLSYLELLKVEEENFLSKARNKMKAKHSKNIGLEV